VPTQETKKKKRESATPTSKNPSEIGRKNWLQKNLLPREKSFVKNCRRKEDL
jgi:hypothetical protein